MEYGKNSNFREIKYIDEWRMKFASKIKSTTKTKKGKKENAKKKRTGHNVQDASAKGRTQVQRLLHLMEFIGISRIINIEAYISCQA